MIFARKIFAPLIATILVSVVVSAPAPPWNSPDSIDSTRSPTSEIDPRWFGSGLVKGTAEKEGDTWVFTSNGVRYTKQSALAGNVILAKRQQERSQQTTLVALKTFASASDAENEAQIQAQAAEQSPAVLKILDAFRVSYKKAKAVIVLPYGSGGNLERSLSELDKLDREDKRSTLNYRKGEYNRMLVFFGLLLEGLVPMHDRAGVANRDIKPDNILLFADGWRLADFGTATLKAEMKNRRVGTEGYIAREPNLYLPTDTKKMDVFSLTLVLIRVLRICRSDTALLLFSDELVEGRQLTPDEISQELKKYIRTDPLGLRVPDGTVNMLVGGLRDQENRMTMKQFWNEFQKDELYQKAFSEC